MARKYPDIELSGGALPQDLLVLSRGAGTGRGGSARLGTALLGPPRCQSPSQRRRLMEPHGPACPGSVLFGERPGPGGGRDTWGVTDELGRSHARRGCGDERELGK